jgi:hypothetical protein
MKTDRRHALQTNWLADHLGRWLKKLKPYTNHLITGALVVAAGLVVWLVVAKLWSGDEEATWQQITLTSGAMLERTIANDSQIRHLADQIRKKRNELNDLHDKRPLVNDKQAQQDHQNKITALSQEIAKLERDLDAKQTEKRESEQAKLRELARENIGSPAGWAAAFNSARPISRMAKMNS